jgi:hypothetical protein
MPISSVRGTLRPGDGGRVDYRDAKAVGDAGERQVADLLRRHAQSCPPARYLSDVLLSVGKMTAQLDHVLIDPRGILVVEVKVRNAYLRGTGDERKWTAVYGGSRSTFQNPLEQMTRQRNTLSQALRGGGWPIPPDVLQSLVVFVGANIEALELDSHNRQRVRTIEQLSAFLRDRVLLAAPLAMTGEQVEYCFQQLWALNRSADPDVQRRHAEYRGGASISGTVQSPTPALPAPVPGAQSAPPPMPASTRPLATLSGNPNRSRSKAAVVQGRSNTPRSSTRLSKKEREVRGFLVKAGVVVVVGIWMATGGLKACMDVYTRSFMQAAPKPSSVVVPVAK